MADHQNRGARRLTVGADIFQQRSTARRIKTCRGLVKDDDLRLHGDDAGNGDAALLSAGQVKGRLVQHIRIHAGKVSRTQNPLPDLVLLQAHVFRAEGDILKDRILKKLIFRVLEYQPHAKPRRTGGQLVLPNALAVQEHVALRGLEQAVEMLDQGGFA